MKIKNKRVSEFFSRPYVGTSAKGGTKNIVIDGNNGEIISESNQQYNEEHDPRI